MTATAGGLVAATGFALFPARHLEVTQGIAVAAVGASAVLLHRRNIGAQLAARGIWIASCIFGTLNLILGSWSQSLPSAFVMAGSGAAIFALGGSGLDAANERDVFGPSRYRARLLVALGLAIVGSIGFAFCGSFFLEAWRLWTSNLVFAAALATGAFGLVRMRTWGLLALGLTHATILGMALSDGLRVPLVLEAIHGLTSAVALVALSPLLALAGKRLLSSEPETTGYRIEAAKPLTAAAAPVDADLEAEADVDAAAAAAEPLPARRYRVG